MTKKQFKRAMKKLNEAIDIVYIAYREQMTEYGDSRLTRPLDALYTASEKLTQYGSKVSYTTLGE